MKKGFTYMEILVVFALIGILAGIIGLKPISNSNETYELDTAMKKLKSDINYVHRKTMAENKQHTITFDDPNSLYIITEKPDTGEDKVIETVKLRDGIKLVSGLSGKPLSFKVKGTLKSGATTIKMYLGSETKELTVIPSTGRAKIKD